MNKALLTIVVMVFTIALIGCSSAGSSDAGRLISGEIVTDAQASLTKASGNGMGNGCAGEVCGVRAYSSNGSHIEGEVDPSNNRWQVRVRAGNWMFGFLDGDGNRLGYLSMNGITALTIEGGPDVDLAQMRLRNGYMVMEQDAEGLGVEGMYTYHHRDRNRNGMPDDFEKLGNVDDDTFNVILIRPFDGQPFVAPCRTIRIIFNTPLDELTVTNETVIVELADGTTVEGQLDIWEDVEYGEYELTFSPAESFPLGAEIAVTIIGGPDGILSLGGEELPEDITISFTVREESEAGLTCHDPDHERQRERIRQRELMGDIIIE